MDRHVLRRQDYSLSSEQEQLRTAFREFLSSRCSIDLVRTAEPIGFDAGLWAGLTGLGASRMALPEALGGDDAGLVDLVLVAEELGRAAAPVCWVDHVAASRALGAHLTHVPANPDAVQSLGGLDWDVPLGVGLLSQSSPQGRLIAGGAVAGRALVFVDDALELWRPGRPVPASNVGPVPAAWWAASAQRGVLATGGVARALHRQARTEWKLLTAATLLGMVAACLDDTVAFVSNRYTRGVAVGSLQAISHPLADIAVALASGLSLARRAAWMLEHEPGERPDLAPAAFVFAARTALRATEFCVHAQGGLGFTTESAVGAYFLRARALIAVGGGLRTDVLDVVAGLDEVRQRAILSRNRGPGNQNRTSGDERAFR